MLRILFGVGLLVASACSTPDTATCGDGVVSLGETCDDGNVVGGDGCSRFCAREGADGSIFEPSHPLFSHVGPASLEPAFNDIDGGSFRIKCGLSHLSYDDPIVFPGEEGAAHLHSFFGSTSADYQLTVDNARDGDASTCQGGPLNLTAYWTPTLLRPLYERDGSGYIMDANGAFVPTGEYRVVYPIDSWELDENGVPRRDAAGELIGTQNSGTDIYYKRPLEGPIVPPPEGLRMIAGDARGTPDSPQQGGNVVWSCHDERHAAGEPEELAPAIPRCFPGHNDDAPTDWRLHLGILFPPCWDGENLDSPDHQSHMAYVQYDVDTDTYACPASHTTMIPLVSYQLYYEVTDHNLGPYGDTRDWFLSSDHYESSPEIAGGASAHGDWFMAWEPEVAETFTRHCIVEGRHCANGDLGNGFRLESLIPGVGNSAGLPIRNRGRGH